MLILIGVGTNMLRLPVETFLLGKMKKLDIYGDFYSLGGQFVMSALRDEMVLVRSGCFHPKCTFIS